MYFVNKKLNQLLINKVIHIIPHDGVGGVEVAARSMLKSDSLNNRFKLFLIAGKSLSENKENVIESPFSSANNPLAYLRGIFKIHRMTPDILVCSLWRSIPIGVVIKILKPKTKLVFFLHLSSTVHLLDRYLHKLMLLYCDFIWADSRSTLNARVNNVHLYRTQVISFVTHKLNPLITVNKSVSLHFVFWGRINHQKGLDRAIRFVKALINAGHHCKYDIWGRDDGEKENLTGLINTLELTDYVEFKGLADYSDLQEISAKHSFYLQFSRSEGMAMSILEAMQLGLIPVVTPVGEIGNYCVDKKNSIVVHELNTFKEPINVLVSILREKKLFERIRNEAINTWKNKPLYKNDFIHSINKLSIK